MDVDTFATLLTPSGQALLAEVHERAGIESDHALGERLRQVHGGDLVAAAVTQNHLRGPAHAAFGSDAARMYFTHDALRHATPARSADHRAHRMRSLGVTGVVDVGCGLGGDLLAFARAGLRVRGVDIDPVRVAIAEANLAALGLPGSVAVGTADDVEVGPDEVVFCDPDRRTSGRRGAALDGLSPNWAFLAGALAGRAVVAVPPGVARDDLPDGVEAECVSEAGEVVGCTLWGAGVDEARHRRRATLLPSGESMVGDADGHTAETDGPVGRFLHLPDDAVIRAGLVGQLAVEMGGWLTDPRIEWITTDHEVTTPFARTYTVVDEVPFRSSKMRNALADRDIGHLTVFSRGLPIAPEALIAKLRLEGSRAATVVLTTVAGAGQAFLVEPR